MEHRIAEYNDNLELYLKQIGGIFDIQSIINEPQDKPQIINYYLKNRIPYRLGYSLEGFIHSSISHDGKHKKEDFKEQARIVERYVHDNNAKKVLELGYGLGPNSAFLASRNPKVSFAGVDISNKPLKRFTKMPNVRFLFCDFHDLSIFEDSVYDIVFAIEALCCSTNKLQVLREVKKKLKKGGLFIVIDAYKRDRATPMTQSEDIMWKLIEKSTAIEKFECVKEVEGYMHEEYSIAEVKDLSLCVLPSLERMEPRARFYFAHPYFAKAVNKVLPSDIVKNALQVLLLPISVKRQIGCYYVHILKNDN